MPTGPRYNTALKIAILTAGMTQLELAYRSGVAEARVSRIVRGHEPGSPDEQKKLAKALRKSVTELFGASAAEEMAS